MKQVLFSWAKGRRRAQRCLLLVLLAVFALGCLPVTVSAASELDEYMNMPDIGHFFYISEGEPDAQLYFVTDEDTMYALLFSGDPVHPDVQKAIDAIAKGSEPGDLATVGKKMLLWAGEDRFYNQENVWGTLLRPALEAGGKSYDTYSDMMTIATLADENVDLSDLGVVSFMDGLEDYMGYLGTGLTLLDYVTAEKGSRQEADAKLTLIKDKSVDVVKAMAEAAGVGAPINLALTGMLMVDSALSDLYNQGIETKTDAMNQVYYHFNEWYARGTPRGARSMVQWRDKILEIMDQNGDDPKKIPELVAKEIDNYCERFWLMAPESQAEVESELGLRTGLFGRSQFTTQDWTKGKNLEIREEITANYKQELTEKLFAVKASIMRHYAREFAQMVQEAMDEKVAFMNDEMEIILQLPSEETDEGFTYPMDGYTARVLVPNEDFRDAYPKFFETKLKGPVSFLCTDVTRNGWLLAGIPKEVAFWAPDQDPDVDDPEFTEKIVLNKRKRPKDIDLSEPEMELEGDYEFVFGNCVYHDGPLEPTMGMHADLFQEGLFADLDTRRLILTFTPTGENTFDVRYKHTIGGEGLVQIDGTGTYDPKSGELNVVMIHEVWDDYNQEQRNYRVEFNFEVDPSNLDKIPGSFKVIRTNLGDDMLLIQWDHYMVPVK